MNHDIMKEFFLAPLECHISLGNGQANKNRTGDCGSATFCIHDLVSKTSKYLILITNQLTCETLSYIKHTRTHTHTHKKKMSQPLTDPVECFLCFEFFFVCVFVLSRPFATSAPTCQKTKQKKAMEVHEWFGHRVIGLFFGLVFVWFYGRFY